MLDNRRYALTPRARVYVPSLNVNGRVNETKDDGMGTYYQVWTDDDRIVDLDPSEVVPL